MCDGGGGEGYGAGVGVERALVGGAIAPPELETAKTLPVASLVGVASGAWSGSVKMVVPGGKKEKWKDVTGVIYAAHQASGVATGRFEMRKPKSKPDVEPLVHQPLLSGVELVRLQVP